MLKFFRLWWITFFSVCLTGLVFSIVAVYKKWDVSPVIVTFATKPVPILNIPFPAVTLCSESKLNANTYNFSDLLDKNLQDERLTLEEMKILNYMSNVCDISKSQFVRLESEYFIDIIEKITPNFYPINCFDLGQNVRCENYFTPLLTDDGLCYTFNILDRTEMFNENVVHFENFHLVNKSAANWSTETGYSRSAGIESYPRRALLHGGRYAFSFDLVTVKNEIVTECKDAVEGYKVSLHSPDRMPRMTQRYFRVPLDSIVAATIRPSMINTSATVKNYPPERRECYFPSEKKLLYFKSYTQTNCNIECLANFTNEVCDCVHFAMPRENGTRICGGKEQKCMLMAERHVQLGRLLQNVDSQETHIDEELKELFKLIGCDCLPLCSHIDYNVGVSQTYWNWTRKRGVIRNLNENDYRLSKLSIFFLSGDFIPSERNELYGPLDFLANIGGLLGLFTGFSILSLIEIIYFLSLRLICNIHIYGHWWTQH